MYLLHRLGWKRKAAVIMWTCKFIFDVAPLVLYHSDLCVCMMYVCITKNPTTGLSKGECSPSALIVAIEAAAVKGWWPNGLEKKNQAFDLRGSGQFKINKKYTCGFSNPQSVNLRAWMNTVPWRTVSVEMHNYPPVTGCLRWVQGDWGCLLALQPIKPHASYYL